MTNKEELYYLAGYFDGEGSIGLYKNDKGKWLATCVLGQAKKDAISIFHKRFGGYFKYQALNKQPHFRWSINSRKEILAFLEEILPCLKEKKEQAEVMLEYCRLDTGKQGKPISLATIEFRTKIASRLKELKHDRI